MASEYFRVNLGALDQATEKRTAEWAQANCVAHRSVRTQDGDVVMHAQRGEKKTYKSHAMAIRTLFRNWGVPLEGAAGDWLVLLSSGQFWDALAGDEAPPRTEPRPWPSDVRAACGQSPREERNRSPLVHQAAAGGSHVPTSDEMANATYLTRLPDGFDMRAAAMLQALRAVACQG